MVESSLCLTLRCGQLRDTSFTRNSVMKVVPAKLRRYSPVVTEFYSGLQAPTETTNPPSSPLITPRHPSANVHFERKTCHGRERLIATLGDL